MMNKQRLKALNILILIMLTSSAYAQSLSDYSDYYSNSDSIDMSDLRWIRSTNDFNQRLLTQEEIDYKISTLINSSNDTYSVEIPYNQKKLKFFGLIHPDSLKIFPKDWFNIYYTSAAGKQFIYQYDIFFISVPDNSKLSALNVFFMIRAINVLKYKYQAAYLKLIQETQYFPFKEYLNTTINNRIKDIKFLNSNKYYFLMFNNTPSGVAQSTTAFANTTTPWTKDNRINVSQNFPIITIHAKKLLGDDLNVGSGGIYKSSSPYINYYKYMRDGIVETLTHEFVHRYIDVNYSVNLLNNNLYHNRSGESDLATLEEAMVRYTTVDFFSKAGGLSPEILYFENVEADLNCVDLTANGKISEYIKNINRWKGTSDSDIFRIFQIPIWEK